MPRILLVEDDEQIRTLLRRELKRAGYDVQEAADGKAARRIYEQQQPDLVITDLVMPEEEGLGVIMDLCRRYPEVKTIAMSGGGQRKTGTYLEAAQKLGARCTLSKPFDVAELLEKVRLVLESEGERGTF